MPFNQGQIGNLFDVGIETSDNTPLTVVKQGGQTLDVARVGYGTMPSQAQVEAINLQEKQARVQLSSPNLIDRDVTNWPQITQGDWSGGIGQRVFNQANQSWTGQGICWPTSDWLPQEPWLGDTVTFSGAGTTPGWFGTVGGFINGGGRGYATCYVSPGFMNVVWVGADGTQYAGTMPTNVSVIDMAVEHGALWIIAPSGTAPLALYYGQVSAGVLVITKLIDGPAGINATAGMVWTGAAGNNQYVAVRYRGTGDTIRVYDVANTAGGSYVSTSAADILFPYGWTVEDAVFSGNTLVLVVTNGAGDIRIVNALVTASPITLSEVSVISGMQTAYVQQVNGQVLIVAQTYSGASLDPVVQVARQVKVFLLIGSTLSEVTDIFPQVGTQRDSFVIGVSRISTFTTYCLWQVIVHHHVVPPPPLVSYDQAYVVVYAYDVLSQRTFIAYTYPYPTTGYGAAIDSTRFAVFGQATRSMGSGPTPVTVPWGWAFNSTNPVNPGPVTFQEFYVAPTTMFNGYPLAAALRGGMDAISSLMDFTSTTPKLWRSVEVQLLGAFPVDTDVTVTLKAWVDQDPEFLGIPTAQKTFSYSNSAGALTLSLPVNKMGRKIVYEVTTTQGAANLNSAPIVVSVTIFATTGWVWNFRLALMKNVRANNQNDYVWAEQNLDEVAAYNFLRGVHRERHGKCKLYLPNGDSFNAQIEDMKFSSPKPVGVSFVGDRGLNYETYCDIIVREDV